ncbi:unnamed protein product [Ostreobium quekettii]|uniref:Protein kinase domain-containing protein n=1 Tax=Ostreobium quekettii TaxID=121088 RepID=A0A8S1J7B3_9CHLO|nr:unnamed protein product [Ostreobium quekettii]
MEGLGSGLFRRHRASSGPLILDHVIKTCQDIARGMKYLHDNNIVHGDLKSSNVLLQSSVTDPRGYVAKVADFGLSQQMMSAKTHITASRTSFGTVTHMPPEVLQQGHLSLAADIYSFGIIMWEMMSGEPPFQNMMQMEVMRKVVLERQRPEFPSWTPVKYRALVDKCWCYEASERIPFQEIYDCLTGLLPDKPSEPSLEVWVSAQREQLRTRSPMSPPSGRVRTASLSSASGRLWTGSLSGRRGVTSASCASSRRGASGGPPSSWVESSSSFDDAAMAALDLKDEWRR